jgi:hypothetical protein
MKSSIELNDDSISMFKFGLTKFSIKELFMHLDADLSVRNILPNLRALDSSLRET